MFSLDVALSRKNLHFSFAAITRLRVANHYFDMRLTARIGISQTYVRLGSWLYENPGVLFVRKVPQADDATCRLGFFDSS